MNLSNLTLLTVTFNNNLLTGMMIKSFFKQMQDMPHEVIIVDNGDKQRASEHFGDIFTVVDNYNHALIKDYKQISKNHCAAIDYALKHCVHTDWVLLVDNDILFLPELKKFLTKFNTNACDCSGEIGWDDAPPNRLFPYFCLINVKKLKQSNISYFDNKRCIGKHSKITGKYGSTQRWYKDTGCSFLEDITAKKWHIQQIHLSNYIVHLKGTLHRKDFVQFLEKYRHLF